MPPYSREIAASSAACRNEVNVRSGSSKITSVVSVNEKLAPIRYVNTSATAVDITLCPLVYSGNGGVCSNGCQRGLMYRLITVSGRIRLVRYFSSQQLMNASIRVIATRECTRTALSKESFA